MPPLNENRSPLAEDPSDLRPEAFGGRDLIGKKVRLSDGQTGEVVHVEYEAPARVALVKTFPEWPSPLTRAALDRHSPPHLPLVLEILRDEPPRP